MMHWLRKMWDCIWPEHNLALALHARRAYIRQQMDQHPAERGDNWRW